jgi:transposase-like protein
MARLVRKYTKEFKQEAVQLALKSHSISDTAKELDILSIRMHREHQFASGRERCFAN